MAFADGDTVEIRRDVLFSIPEVKGYWRHGDEWQIIPAPRKAPRPEFLLGEFPFVLEDAVPASTNFVVSLTRRRQRGWQLHLVVSLLLRGAVIRESESPQHHWVLREDNGKYDTEYLNDGYMVGTGFRIVSDGFSDTPHIPRMTVVDDTCTTRRIEFRRTRWRFQHP